MSRDLPQGHQSLAQEQRLWKPPCSSLSGSGSTRHRTLSQTRQTPPQQGKAGKDENCASGSNKKGRRAPEPRGSGLEAAVRPDMLCTGSIQDPWRTHLAIHRLRHSTSWKVLPLLRMGQPASTPRVPLEEGTDGRVPPNHDPQKEPTRPLVTRSPVGVPQASPHRVSHYPFPKRKAPLISEAARGLGLYRPSRSPPAGWAPSCQDRRGR